jgi:hypothetical protein
MTIPPDIQADLDEASRQADALSRRVQAAADKLKGQRHPNAADIDDCSRRLDSISRYLGSFKK